MSALDKWTNKPNGRTDGRMDSLGAQPDIPKENECEPNDIQSPQTDTYRALYI